jgi:hypothetical protein
MKREAPKDESPYKAENCGESCMVALSHSELSIA